MTTTLMTFLILHNLQFYLPPFPSLSLSLAFSLFLSPSLSRFIYLSDDFNLLPRISPSLAFTYSVSLFLSLCLSLSLSLSFSLFTTTPSPLSLHYSLSLSLSLSRCLKITPPFILLNYFFKFALH